MFLLFAQESAQEMSPSQYGAEFSTPSDVHSAQMTPEETPSSQEMSEGNVAEEIPGNEGNIIGPHEGLNAVVQMIDEERPEGRAVQNRRICCCCNQYVLTTCCVATIVLVVYSILLAAPLVLRLVNQKGCAVCSKKRVGRSGGNNFRKYYSALICIEWFVPVPVSFHYQSLRVNNL